MPVRFDTLADLRAHGFDAVIDVRSPSEYAEDHFPGAINLPVLSDAERAEIGTIYKQTSPFEARKKGAALVARSAAHHIETALMQHDGGWRPLVYCWRGGQRSGAFTSILQQIGWRAETVEGGYRSYRRLVQAALYDMPLPHRFVLLDGNTGTAKTALLGRLRDLGVQTLDLEALARHRGSLLGEMPGGQPKQKGFESALSAALDALDPGRPVLVEAESSKIGQIVLPPQLWQGMTAAPRIEIAAPVAARAAFLTQAYEDVTADPEALSRRLDPLRAHRGHAVVDGWQALLAERSFRALAEALIVEHYDPAYARSRAAHAHPVIARLGAERLDAAGLDELAGRIAAVLSET